MRIIQSDHFCLEEPTRAKLQKEAKLVIEQMRCQLQLPLLPIPVKAKEKLQFRLIECNKKLSESNRRELMTMTKVLDASQEVLASSQDVKHYLYYLYNYS